MSQRPHDEGPSRRPLATALAACALVAVGAVLPVQTARAFDLSPVRVFSRLNHPNNVDERINRAEVARALEVRGWQVRQQTSVRAEKAWRLRQRGQPRVELSFQTFNGTMQRVSAEEIVFKGMRIPAHTMYLVQCQVSRPGQNVQIYEKNGGSWEKRGGPRTSKYIRAPLINATGSAASSKEVKVEWVYSRRRAGMRADLRLDLRDSCDVFVVDLQDRSGKA